ncbi:hypothetical protein SAMN05216591_0698 [Pseudomonas extremaustralis]|uniref:Uncharacterized protein n=2 Tax=Pseudomonas extremaustralis TaxID=359110 RepID=A0ABY0MY92_9PSED|nr:hypothetical protein SAMN05216591_0698 [Pseudomonas extremaustralis]
MSSSFRCFGVVGTYRWYCGMYDDDFIPPAGNVPMVDEYPQNPGPTRFGAWFVSAEGTFYWNQYPDPPFNIVYHEGKMKNSDTMVEIAIETLPGNVAARLDALEAAVFPTTP